MGSKSGIKNWKLSWALLLISLLCGHAALHVELRYPIYRDASTVSAIQVSGANVAAGMVSWSLDGSAMRIKS